MKFSSLKFMGLKPLTAMALILIAQSGYARPAHIFYRPQPKVVSAPLPEPQESSPLPEPQVESSPLPDPQVESSPLPEPQFESAPLPEPIVESAPLPEPEEISSPLPEPKSKSISKTSPVKAPRAAPTPMPVQAESAPLPLPVPEANLPIPTAAPRPKAVQMSSPLPEPTAPPVAPPIAPSAAATPAAAAADHAPVATATATATPAPAPAPVVHPGASVSHVCSQLPTSKQANCEAIRRNFPNKKAFDYSIAYLVANTPQIADTRCLASGSRAKIQNTCQLVINDVQTAYGGNSLRSAAYMVDLCAKKSSDRVYNFYMNKGTGKRYVDTEGAHSTNMGVYLTDSHIEAFNPFKVTTSYVQIRRHLGIIPVLRLEGLQASNNDTAHGKPFHISPYNSSWGCPSTGEQHVKVMRKLAAGGRSIIVNYGPSSKMDINKVNTCEVAGYTTGRPGGSRARVKVSVRHKNGRSHSTRAKRARSGRRHSPSRTHTGARR